jgi:hypothetical protein
MADTVDWMIPLVTNLRDSNGRIDRSIQRKAFKYVLIDDELYHRTPNDIMLMCLGPDDAILAMTEVHEAIYGTH